MTESQAKRTRLQVWKDLLTDLGGTPGFYDTLLATLRKAAVAAGATPHYNDTLNDLARRILSALGGTPSRNDTFYRLERKIMVVQGADLDCCALPPIQAMPRGGGRGGDFLVDPHGTPVVDPGNNRIHAFTP